MRLQWNMNIMNDMAFTIFVYFKDTCRQISLDSNTSVTIGSTKRNTLSIPDSGLADAQFSFVPQKDGHVDLVAKSGVFSKGTEIAKSPVSIGDVYTCGEVSVYICPKQADYERSVHLSENREFLIGRSRECSIRFSDKRVSSRHARISFESGRYKLTDLDSKNHTFVNGKQITAHYLKDGDAIWIGYYGIVFESGELSFLNTGDELRLMLDEKEIVRRYPFFRRSPRLKSPHDVRTVEVQQPPDTGEKPQVNWLLVFLPPLGMVGTSVLIMYVSKGSLMNLLYILPMSFITLLTTVISYFAQVRKYHKDRKKKIKSYDEYMEQVMAGLEADYSRQLSLANTANPETGYCHEIAANRMRRLWERSAEDEDFLEMRLGKGILPLETEISLPKTAIGEDRNPQLEKLRSNVENIRMVRDIAVTLPLNGTRTVGVVGNRQVGVKAVQNGIIQLVTNHSYTELNLVVIANEENYGEWAWTRWLPHIWDSSRQMRFLSSNKKEGSELLGYFEEVLKKRMDFAAREKNGGTALLPHIVFVVTDYSLTENRGFLRLAATADSSVGITAFLLFDSLNKLPKECDWFVELNNSGGSLYSKADSTGKISFTLDDFEEYERFARTMAPIRDRSFTQGGSLPHSVTFFQGYGIKNVTGLQMLRRWTSAKPYESLAVPIGTKENGKAFLFDIHEKAHGPHGLVAGTTGSGKSEVLQTYILSMCIHFPPEAVSFVLIDFKGTGLAGSLKSLPHIAGVITDIDENIQRNLFSLEAEIERRKKLFAEVSGEEKKIQDIYEYQKEYYNGNLREPLSHLIVVIDEFTELKSKFPDFMAAVERASRVGRTLGIHLILATQKPGGAVSDEIRANTNFKWCLRVKEGESKDVLGRPEAERISQEYPGRAYIQVGNNEIFEQVQIYYSGAEVPNEESADAIQVSFVDAMGHREAIKTGSQGEKESQEKELFSLVKYIVSEAVQSGGIPAARKIWEKHLPDHVSLPELPQSRPHSRLSAVIGITDDPRRQRQYHCEIDFSAEGHILIYGAPGTGKTMLLQTIVMSLAERYTPDEVNMYVMDFGSWSMKNMQALPHMGGVANGNESEKITKLARMLATELDRRKMMFAQKGAGSLEVYRQVSGRSLPSIIIAVDNFAPIREMYSDIEEVFVRLSREGSGFGIYLVITASSLSGSVGYNLSQNFKQALALRMTEKADYRDIVGDTQGLEPSKIAGRGLVRGNPPMEFQTALAVPAENDVEYVANLKRRCKELADGWTGELPQEIPVMPEIVLPGHIRGISPDRIVVGLSEEETMPVTFPRDNRLTLISGMEESGKTNMLRIIARQLAGTCRVLFVNADKEEDAGKRIADIIRRASAEEKTALFVDNFPKWLSEADYQTLNDLEDLAGDRKNHSFSLYAAGDAAEVIQESSGIVGRMIRSGYSILLGGSFQEHSCQFEVGNIGYLQKEQQLPPYYGYLVWKKKAVLFKALYWEGGGGHGV
ncbi:type VII secretion protein EssC [Lachnospiraceae bacterium M18-1]|nr:type VII secretion protein EssC [Lachnospiraceae bacterium M18-1]